MRASTASPTYPRTRPLIPPTALITLDTGAEFYCWIDELTSDYLGSTGKWVGPIGDIYFVEAPAMFKVGSVRRNDAVDRRLPVLVVCVMPV